MKRDKETRREGDKGKRMQPIARHARLGERQGTYSLLISLSPCLLVCLLSAASGCASFDLPTLGLEKYIPSLTGRIGEFRRPLKVVAFWTDTVRTAEGQPAMRGFGGRLMFYDNQRGKPVKVAGTLVIYGFDEARSDTDNPRPDRKFVFTPDQFEKHYSKSELGHSYSVWIPWDRAGGPSQEVSLICRFTPVEGGAVVSEQVKQLLPGVDAATSAKAAPSATPIKLTQFQETLQEAAARRMSTTTIELSGPPDRRLPTAHMRPRPNWNALPVGGTTNAAAMSPMSATSFQAPAPGPSSANSSGENPAQESVGQQATAADRAAAPAATGSWLARFGQHQSRVPGAPIVPPDRARGPWQPTHVIQPPGPATTPTSSQATLPATSGAASPP